MVAYCSQDLHGGTRTTANTSTFGYYFSGAVIVQSTLRQLQADHGMDVATDIIVTGDSAGGIAVYVWARLCGVLVTLVDTAAWCVGSHLRTQLRGVLVTLVDSSAWGVGHTCGHSCVSHGWLVCCGYGRPRTSWTV